MKSKVYSLWAVAALIAGVQLQALNEIPDDVRIGGLAIGCQAYTFHRYTTFEAIEKTAQAGGKVIELFPGQKLSPDSDAKLDHNASAEVIEKLQAKLKQHNVRAVNYGVVGLPDNEEECRKIFEFAKKLGLYAVTSEPNPAAFDLIEKMVREYDIAMAIHNHPKRPNDPNYKYWDPEYIMSLVKNRDKRMGACADTGHFARSGLDVVKVLKTLEGRIISAHLKDIRPAGPRGADVPYGTGESDIPAILNELLRQKVRGNISVEYESNLQHNVGEAGQCIGYVRGYLEGLQHHRH
jgi:sugar phosphate isomerase/epimerase